MSKLDIVGICSGYFNPLHDGHLAYIEASYDYCVDCNPSRWLMIVVINNDKQVALKNSIPFIDENVRSKILNSLTLVDTVYKSVDQDLSIATTLELIAEQYAKRKLYFFNAGDRSSSNFNQKEHEVCQRCGIEEVWLDLPKINSSSEILNKVGREWFERRLKNEQN